jgi:hypothetical protein
MDCSKAYPRQERGEGMLERQKMTQRREKNQMAKADQRAVNGAFTKLTGRSHSEQGLKQAERLAVVLAHFGMSRDGMTKAEAMATAAQMARNAGLSRLPRPSAKVCISKSAARTVAAVVGPEFYDSWAWKEARFVALKRHGRRCQCCGWTPGDSAGGYLVVDHINPIRTHPHLALDPDNHQVLCNDCNMGKSYKHTDDFRK